MKSIGQALDEARGIGPGFDFMRLALAFSVIGWHSIPLVTGSADALKTEPWWILVYSIVPVFFALSGFLVTGSALRLPLKQFVASRALRILPALFVDTAFSVLIVGAIFTTLPILSYLTHPETMKYWLNIIGEIHYYLPGVFKDNPNQAVNGSLWTIRPELGCYLVMAMLIGTGLVRRWQVVAIALLGLFLISFAAQQYPGDFILKYHLGGDAAKLVMFFLAGSLAYLLRYHIPLSGWLAGVVCAFMGICAFVGSQNGTLLESRPFLLMSIPLLTYLMVWLGMRALPKIPIYDRGDYSYGIYLYGFPIQQVIVQLTGTSSPLLLFVLTIVPVTLLAMFSWHVVEKPTLKLRKYLKPPPARVEPEPLREAA